MPKALTRGSPPSTRRQFDQAFDPALRAELDSRWVETDYTTWYPVSNESHRHFTDAMAAYANKDKTKAVAEVRRGVAYLRLEDARATGVAQHALDRSVPKLDRLARDIAAGSARDKRMMGREMGEKSSAAARDAAGQARRAGDKLAAGASWTKNEVEHGLRSLGNGIERFGRDIDSNGHQAPEKVSP